MPIPTPRLRLLVAGVSLSLGAAAQAPDSPGALAESLIKLRAEVEQLNGEVELQRQEARTNLAALSAQKAELQAQVQRAELNARKLREDLAKREAEAGAAGVAGDALKPVLLAAIDELRARIAAGLPFKQAERLAQLDDLKRQLEGGTLPPPRAANRLWAAYEDEFRVTRENGIHSQTITLDGAEVLVDVAKVGSMMLFFRAPDGRVGIARRSGSDWRFEPLADEAGQKQVLAYFDALGKQIRQGWFELPNGLAGGAR
ncbi:MAG: DUF3450 family protein [Rhodanobacteraceae bacterium]|nr:DUF3450 family protein [Rhodanobacteraceae bacterium]